MKPIPTGSTLGDIGNHPMSMGASISENSAFPLFTSQPREFTMIFKPWFFGCVGGFRISDIVESEMTIMNPNDWRRKQ